MTSTGDTTADFLLRQLRYLKRLGTAEQRTCVAKWETVLRAHAEPAAPGGKVAVNFATAKKTEGGK